MRAIAFISVLFWLSLSFSPPICRADGDIPVRNSVLVLNSYHWGAEWAEGEMDGLLSEFRASDLDIELFIEQMDVLRQPQPFDSQGILEHLRRRYQAESIDLVVVTDDAALAFVAKHYQELFSGLPVVFSDVSQVDLSKLPSDMPVTGIMEHRAFMKTVEIARQLLPDATQIVVFGNENDNGSGPRTVQKILSELALDIPVHIHNDLSLEQMLALTAGIPPQDILINLALAYDHHGRLYTYEETKKIVSEIAPTPQFDFWSLGVNAGISLGGLVNAPEWQGQAAARLAIRILRGEDARQIPIIRDAPTKLIVNYQVLQRYALPESALPKETLFIDKPPSLYSEHKKLIWAAFLVMLGLLLVISILLLNIRRRQAAENALRTSMTQLQTVITGAPIVLFAFDQDAVFTLSEGKGLKAMGFQPEEMVGQSAFTVYAEQPEILGCMHRAMQGETFTATVSIGPQKYLAYHTPLTDEQGEREGTIGVLVDITEQAMAEEALRQLNEELEQRVAQRTEELVRSEKLASLGALVAGVSHELSTPLGSSLTVATALSDRLKELAEHVQQGDVDPEMLRNFLAIATEASTLLTQTIIRSSELVQNFKKMAVDQASEQRRIFDPAETVNEIISALKFQYKNSPYQFTLSLPADIRMDSFPGALGQVVMNLVNNAMTHAFPHGTPGEIVISVTLSEPTQVRLTVADNGQGIPNRDLPRVFDPFFTTRLGQGGSGLGLHIVYNIVTHILGGRVDVQSEPDRGTLFTLELPLEAPATGAPDDIADR